MLPEGQKDAPLKINYIFKFADGNSANFEILLDAATLNCITNVPVPPDWANLLYYQCDNCPLDEVKHKYCPIAVNLGGLVKAFEDISSYETAHVLVMTKQRDMSKTTTVQEGLSSLFGVYMVTSGCPIMEKLKPVVRYHLPFATLEESVVRVASMYLLIQHLLMKKKKDPDWELKKLEKMYEEIRLVNAGFARRLKHAATKDASLAAIENLDCIASLLPFVITDTLESIEKSLDAYLEEIK